MPNKNQIACFVAAFVLWSIFIGVLGYALFSPRQSEVRGNIDVTVSEEAMETITYKPTGQANKLSILTNRGEVFYSVDNILECKHTDNKIGDDLIRCAMTNGKKFEMSMKYDQQYVLEPQKLIDLPHIIPWPEPKVKINESLHLGWTTAEEYHKANE